jgi:ankyrin repeat protein
VYDTQGSGALHKAAEKANKEMVLLLVISGADPNYKNNS